MSKLTNDENIIMDECLKVAFQQAIIDRAEEKVTKKWQEAGLKIYHYYKTYEAFKPREKELKKKFYKDYKSKYPNSNTQCYNYWNRMIYKFAFPNIKLVDGKLFQRQADGSVVENAKMPIPVCPLSVKEFVSECVKDGLPISLAVVAASRSGKTLLGNEIVTELINKYNQEKKQIKFFILTATNVDLWRIDGATTLEWSAETLAEILSKRNIRNPMVIVLDDLGASSDARFNEHLDGLFMTYRNDGVGGIVLSQQANDLFNPKRRQNAQCILWAGLTEEPLTYLRKSMVIQKSKLKLDVFVDWSMENTGSTNNFQFAGYLRAVKNSFFLVRAGNEPTFVAPVTSVNVASVAVLRPIYIALKDDDDDDDDDFKSVEEIMEKCEIAPMEEIKSIVFTRYVSRCEQTSWSFDDLKEQMEEKGYDEQSINQIWNNLIKQCGERGEIEFQEFDDEYDEFDNDNVLEEVLKMQNFSPNNI